MPTCHRYAVQDAPSVAGNHLTCICVELDAPIVPDSLVIAEINGARIVARFYCDQRGHQWLITSKFAIELSGQVPVRLIGIAWLSG